ncbi:efflux RND transporter periplasmic adaptor subunit [Novosphingobium sp. FSW06-99]|uniref:efflux RND transporter periplasmic adaptor subunit n=1 Tax=Novosphingobium sp. FSW06-99 TaxID=1739113 RepID=UPI000AB2C7F1|nr:HlyD family efflux transporter periplasmic adaptor subunit [Novosphingobium sp. FSW06-99]
MASSSPDGPTSISGATMDRVIARPAWRWRSRRMLAYTLPPLAIAAAAFGWQQMPASGSTDIAAADITISPVERAPFADVLPVRATVAPAVTTFIGAVAGGQVEKLLVQDGARVVAGQPLATLDNPTLKLDILTREAAIASQLGSVSGEDLSLERNRLDRTNQISTADYDLLKAQRDLSIRRQLHDQGFVSDEGVKSYQQEADYQTKRLSQLRQGQTREDGIASVQAARLAQTRNRLANNLTAVEAQFGALVLKAPVAGRLSNFTIEPGQTLKANDQVGQIDSEGNWKLVADVDEYYLGRVRAGQLASGDNNVQLVVTKVLPTVTAGRFHIELGFRNAPPAGLGRGQAFDVRVILGATRAALVAPVGGWLDAGGGSSAFVVDADGRHARRVPVRVGRRNPERVEIETGLKAGDHIVTSTTASIKGDILNIR